jgi:hypothetical protein
MSALEQLISAVQAGLEPRFADLPESARAELTNSLVPVDRPFTPEERALFSGFCLHLDTPEKVAEVEAFNALPLPNKAPILTDAQGRNVLPADLMTWCGEGDGYHQIQQLMWSCPIIQFVPAPVQDLFNGEEPPAE